MPVKCVVSSPVRAALRIVAAGLLLASCQREGGEKSPDRLASADDPVTLAYVEWSTEIASTHLVKAFLQEKMGVACRIVPMSAAAMWDAVGTGEVDAIVSAWLPLTHESYYALHRSRVEDLGPNLEGTRIGLVVPEVRGSRQTDPTGKRTEPLVGIRSIEELPRYADRLNYSIIGIDAEAGIMMRTREALDRYGLESEFELVEGSEAKMVETLVDAIQNQRWIVVTGWEPHWLFGRYNLRFLEDPKNVFGGTEAIHTIARQGLRTERPTVYAALDAFSWNKSQMNLLMAWIERDEGLYAYRSAVRWMEAHPGVVESWIPDPETSN